MATPFAFLFFAMVSGIQAQFVITADTIYTMAGPPLIPGVILVENGKIKEIGNPGSFSFPEDVKTYNATVVTPGLIDAHSVVGLSGILNYSQDQDQLDKTSPVQPELRAIDAFNMQEELVEYVRGLGITTLHTGHGPGALASGQTMVVKTFAGTLAEAIVDSSAMVAFTLGSSVGGNFKSPGTRAKGMAMLRHDFLKAKEYQEKINKSDGNNLPPRDLKMEALADVLSGRLKALFTVNETTEIMAAIRLANEFDFDLVLDGAAEAYLLLDEIKAAKAPVILHPSMKRAYGENKNVSMETAVKLKNAGIPFAIQSGYEGYVPKTRIVLFEAAMAHVYGLPFENALGSITLEAAKILGIDNRTGSLEVGKDADIVLFDGNPFEYTTHVCHVFINGNLAKENCY